MKKTRIIIPVLLIAMLLLLSGCHKQNQASPSPVSEPVATAAAETPEPTSAATDEPVEEPQPDDTESGEEDNSELVVEDEYIVEMAPDQETAGW